MGKSISNLYRYAEVSKACNQRLMDAMADVVPVRAIQQEIGKICSGKNIKGRHVSDFNVWAPTYDALWKLSVMADIQSMVFATEISQELFLPEYRMRKSEVPEPAAS